MKTKKVIKNIMFIIGILVLLWIAVSFIDVILHNSPTTSGETYNWNFFDLCLHHLWRGKI